MYNILFANAGRRGTLIKDFKQSIGNECKILATDNWAVAPAIFLADEYRLTSKITEEDYFTELLEICEKENISAVMTLIDPEIMLLAEKREEFTKRNILLLCPSLDTAKLCFDKYAMYEYLIKNNIPTVKTYDSLNTFLAGMEKGEIQFPVFIKPRTGSGSVGAQKVNTLAELKVILAENKFDYIIQEFMDCEDFDADVYVDTISNKPVAIFSKKKIETRIGGASKTISFKDPALFEFVKKIISIFEFYGPIDMDFFYKEGQYYLSEINPRLGGAYLNAYGAGVDFPKYVLNNIKGIENKDEIGNYNEGVIMLMYDEVVIVNEQDLKGDYRD